MDLAVVPFFNSIVTRLSSMLLFCMLMAFTSCNEQASSNLPKNVTTTSKLSPVVIRTPLPPGFTFDGVVDTTLVSQYIRSIYHDTKGNLWFGTAFEGVCKYHTDTLTYYTKLDVFDANSVHSIAEDKQGNIWFATDSGVFKYYSKKFTKYAHKQGLINISKNKKGCITNNVFIDKSNNLWLSTPSGVFRYNGKNFTIFPLLPAVSFSNILQDKDANIWFASTENGVYKYNGKTISNFSVKNGLISNEVGTMLQDKNGIIWFSTNKGISQYNGKTITHLTTKEGIPNNEIWGIYQEKSGIIWITARGSTTRYNPDADKEGENAFTVFTPKDGLNCCVQSMYQDREGNMWWGAGSGLFRFDGKQFYQVKQKGPW